jgi:two-component system sensor histidine kinase HydH
LSIGHWEDGANGQDKQGSRRALNLRECYQATFGIVSASISSLSSALTHELRNPLSSVKMAVQSVSRNNLLPERDRRRLEIANREIRTIERMLSLFSEFGRDAPLCVESVPVRTLVEEAAAMLEQELGDRRITIDVDEAKSLPSVRADIVRLRPILAQLLLNVAMGLADGGVVHVRLEKAKGGCAVRVEDRSAKIPREAKEHVFEPFGRFSLRGPGLSLATLRKLMELHGGRLDFSERSGSGVVFTLTFPL